MKIDFDMLERQVAAGMPAEALLIYIRTLSDAHDAKRAKKRPADARRTRGRRERDMGGHGRDMGVTAADAKPLTEEQELFKAAKQVLGKTAGGLVANLIKACGYDLKAARGVIDVAATKGDPRQYVVACLNKGTVNGAKNPTMAAFDDLIARSEGGAVEGDPAMRDVTPRRA